MTDLATLTGPQLVHEYNTLAAELGEPGVNRFRSREVGVRRCLAIQERYDLVKNSYAEEDDVGITEAIRAAQKEDVSLPENPEEAKVHLAGGFVDYPPEFEEVQELVQEPSSEEQENLYYADAPQEVSVINFPAPETVTKVKKQRKPRAAKPVQVTGPIKKVDLPSPVAVPQAFEVRDETDKARLVEATVKRVMRRMAWMYLSRRAMSRKLERQLRVLL